MHRTFILIRHEALQRELVGEIIQRFERRGIKIIGMKMVRPTHEQAERLYEEHVGKPFFRLMVEYLTGNPLIAVALEGYQAVWMIKAMVGITKPLEAHSGTIRGDLAVDVGRNLIYCPYTKEDAEVQLSIFFEPDELLDYTRSSDQWILENPLLPD